MSVFTRLWPQCPSYSFSAPEICQTVGRNITRDQNTTRNTAFVLNSEKKSLTSMKGSESFFKFGRLIKKLNNAFLARSKHGAPFQASTTIKSLLN